MSVLSISSLHVAYKHKKVIQGLELAVHSGEIVALFGPSGCGKTTVLKSVAGLLEQATGNIRIAGHSVLSESENLATEKRKVGLIFQDYALFPHLTVAENVAFGLSALNKNQKQAKVDQMLALVKMTSYAQSYPSQLSGGQQQRIAIIRALACEPDILLFDEAFSNIDPQLRFELISEIRALLKKHNTAALFVTHNQDEAFAFCDRIAVMHQGKIEQIDRADKLFNEPKTKFVAEFLGDGVWLKTKVINPNLLSSELGDVVYSGHQKLDSTIGQDVDVYVRPHQLTLIPNPQAKIIVEHERFVGDFYESQINFSGQLINVRTKYSFLNQRVDLGFDASVAAVFPVS